VNELRHDEPSIPFALFLGIALGLAALPGGSYIGAVLVMSSWMGLKKDLALDLAMFLTATALLEKCLHTFLFHSILPDISLPLLMMAFVTAFLGTTVAIRATRFLLEKRALALVAFWTFPLALAILAYSRAFSEGLSLATFTRPG
jgi:undecaprenyl pyrophosphate phosphatase UppP